MSAASFLAALLLVTLGFLAGFFGALLGLGGGVLMVPFMDMLLGFDIKEAAASSIVAIVGGKFVSSSTYLDKKLAKPDIALKLVFPAIIGSFVGLYLSISLSSNIIRVIFGLLLIYATYYILTRGKLEGFRIRENVAKEHSSTSYFDEALNAYVDYTQRPLKFPAVFMFFSGLAASLLGIGGGVINMPVLVILVGLPIKVAAATSTLIIFITALSSAMLQLKYGYVIPWASGSLLLGAMTGAWIGARIMNKLRSDFLRKLFSVVLIYTAVRLILKGLGVPFPF